MTTRPLIPAGLRCAHLVEPLGVAPDRVRLSWTPEGAGTGRAQRAYQVQVAPSEERLITGEHLSWDSGRVESANSADIAYAGRPLARGGRYLWRVRLWDDRGQVSGWSEHATFEVELHPAKGWRACWISQDRTRESVSPPAGAGPRDSVAAALTPAPYLRRGFTVDQAGGIRAAVRDRPRPVRGAAERAACRRCLPRARLD